MRWVACPSRGDQRARRRRGRSASGVDELFEAVDPGFLVRLHRAVPKQLLRPEQRSRWTWRRPAERRGCPVPGRAERGSFFTVAVAVTALIFGVLNAGLGNPSAGPWSFAGAGTTVRDAGRGGLGAGSASRATSETFCTPGHGDGEVEDVPQPPTWRAKCRRLVPRTRDISLGQESKGG